MSYKVTAADLSEIRLNESDTVSSVLQNIAILIATRKGSVPLHRDFGLPMTFLDKPMHIAQPLIVAEVREAIETFEPRAEFINVTFDVDINNPGKLIPTVEVEIHE